MTVNELMNKLKDFDGDRLVFVRCKDEDNKITEFELSEYNECEIYNDNDGVIIDIVDWEVGKMIIRDKKTLTEKELLELQNSIKKLYDMQEGEQ